MIIGFQHKGLQLFFETGSTKGIQAIHAKKLNRILTAMHAANSPIALNLPAYRLHQLQGKLQGFWSITVSGNWRVIFRFKGDDIELVDYLDYH